MDELTQQLAALEVVDMLRRSSRMPLPDAELIIEFSKLACEMMRKPYTGSDKIRNRRIVSFFGAPALVIAKLWELLMEKAGPWPIGAKKKHLLWGLHLAKVYASEAVLSSNVSAPDEKTFRKWAWLFLTELASLTFDVASDRVYFDSSTCILVSLSHFCFF
jgi:hypothetical protein